MTSSEHEEYGSYEVWMDLFPRRSGCSEAFPFVVVLHNRMYGYFSSAGIDRFKEGELLPMTIKVGLVLDDVALSELQERLGTSEAATPAYLVPESAFIETSKAIKNSPGYNQVEVVLPVDGEALLRGLGYLKE